MKKNGSNLLARLDYWWTLEMPGPLGCVEIHSEISNSTDEEGGFSLQVGTGLHLRGTQPGPESLRSEP